MTMFSKLRSKVKGGGERLRRIRDRVQGIDWRWEVRNRRRQWVPIISALVMGTTIGYVMRIPEYAAALYGALERWWYIGPTLRFFLWVAVAGFVVTVAVEWEDWSRRSGPRRRWVRRLLLPFDAVASCVLLCWSVVTLPFHIWYWLRQVPEVVEGVGWLIWDEIVAIITNGLSRVYGTHVICGLPGYGKTQYAAYTLARFRKRYGDRIGIGSNLAEGWRGDPTRGIRGQDVAITGWRQIVEIPLNDPQHRTWVFFIDEAQNTFGSREWGKFPKKLEFMTTQARKYGQGGVMLLLTCQDFMDLDPKLRRLAQKVIDARSWFRGRHVHLTGYEGEAGYKNGEDPLIGPKRKVIMRDSFVARPWVRRSFNSYDLARILKEYDDEEPEDPTVELIRALEKERAENRRNAELLAAAVGVNGKTKGRHN